jgi:hypothetical protein
VSVRIAPEVSVVAGSVVAGFGVSHAKMPVNSIAITIKSFFINIIILVNTYDMKRLCHKYPAPAFYRNWAVLAVSLNLPK